MGVTPMGTGLQPRAHRALKLENRFPDGPVQTDVSPDFLDGKR